MVGLLISGWIRLSTRSTAIRKAFSSHHPTETFSISVCHLPCLNSNHLNLMKWLILCFPSYSVCKEWAFEWAEVAMTAFEWGMLGLFLFFSLVTFWCLYSYRANQKLSGQGKSQVEEWERKHESKSQKWLSKYNVAWCSATRIDVGSRLWMGVLACRLAISHLVF